MNLILFDIDNTLLDTPRYAHIAFARMRKVLGLANSDQVDNVTADFLQKKEAYYQTLQESTDFSPEDFIDFLKVHDETLNTQLLSCWYDEAVLKECLFSDFTRNIERFRSSATLGIFSQGNTKFQTKKLSLMGIIGNFEQKYVFIKTRKDSPESLRELKALLTPSELHSFDKIIVIDDKLKHLVALQEIHEITPVLIQRKTSEKSATQNAQQEIRIITTLDDYEYTNAN